MEGWVEGRRRTDGCGARKRLGSGIPQAVREQKNGKEMERDIIVHGIGRGRHRGVGRHLQQRVI